MAEGFTKVDNDILEALCQTRLSSKQIRVFLYIIRWTAGFQSVYGRPLSVAKMASDLDDDRRHIQNTIRALECMGMIRIMKKGQGTRAEFEVLPVSCWNQNMRREKRMLGAPKTAHVTCADNGAGGAPITAQVHAPITAHKKRKKQYTLEKKESKKGVTPSTDDEGEDPWITYQKFKEKQNGDL